MERLSRITRLMPPKIWIVMTIVWMCFIFFLSGRQQVSVSEQFWTNFIVFKMLHVIEYSILTFLNTMAFVHNATHVSYNKALRYAVFTSILYALSDEIHQTFVPTREGTLRDVLIDGIGVISVYWLASRYERIPKNAA